MSPRKTSYVAPEHPKGSSKRQNGRFPSKIVLCLKKVCYKVSLCENVSDKVVRHLLAQLSVRKWLVGTSPCMWKFGRYWPTPLQNADFESIFARSTSAVTPSKKVQLTLIGSPLLAFQCSRVRRLAVAKDRATVPTRYSPLAPQP